jgi:DNA-binding LacI/PurR family transcriptional regulator
MRSRRRGKPLPDRPVLAIVNSYSQQDGWRGSASRTIRETLAGVLAQAQARGYEGQEVWLHKDGMSNERFSEVLRARGIHGVLLGPVAQDRPLPALRWPDFSVVRVGVPDNGLPLRAVCHDNFNAGLTAVRESIKAGRKRPGMILLRKHTSALHHRWDGGFYAGSADLPANRRIPAWILEDWPTPAVLREWIQARRPDVIITPDHETIGKTLVAAGFKVPADLGLVTLACPEPGNAISGIFQNGRLIGASAADMLVDLVERHERGLPADPIAMMVEGRWNPGATLRVP